MTDSDISAVDEFLAFSLPSDSAAQLARRDAIAKAMDSRQSTTALVGYRATGLVLIVGPEPYALSVAEELVGKVTLAILATEGNNLSTGSEKPVFTREIDGQIILVAVADLMDVGGYLGAFEVTVDVNGESQNLAGLMDLTSQTFDVVLDLGRKPAITLELPPPGYFAVSANRENMPKVLEEIAGLNGEFEKPQYVHYDPDICAHGERGITGCTRCIDTCPAGAVISIGERVEVDVHRCHGMGSCSAVCPTGALTYAYPSLGDTMNRLRQVLTAWRISGMPAPCILLYDSGSGAEYLRTVCADFPDGVLPWRVEEIGSTGIEVWLSALAYGAVGIRILTHESTPGAVLTTLAKQIELIRCLLEGLDYDGQSIAELPAVEFPSADWPQYVDESVVADVATFGGVDNKRDALRLVFDYLTPESSPIEAIALPAASPFGQIHVDTALCTLCMGCVSVCPAGALADGSDTPKLDFIEWNCVQCGLCERACPENAIALEARLLVDSDSRLMKRTLNEEEPFGCIVCGKPFATKSMIDKMAETLASHRMFQGDALDHLKMCEDCRVKSMFGA